METKFLLLASLALLTTTIAPAASSGSGQLSVHGVTADDPVWTGSAPGSVDADWDVHAKPANGNCHAKVSGGFPGIGAKTNSNCDGEATAETRGDVYYGVVDVVLDLRPGCSVSGLPTVSHTIAQDLAPEEGTIFFEAGPTTAPVNSGVFGGDADWLVWVASYDVLEITFEIAENCGGSITTHSITWLQRG